MPISEYFGSVDKVIKRDDIRGVYGVNIDFDFAHRLGRVLAEFFTRATAIKPVNVAVGHDMRLSGPVLAAALCEGLAHGGCRPIEMGLAGTELVGFLPAHYSDVIDGGVMITASHNPPDNNGFKFFGRGGQPLPLAEGFKAPCPEDVLKRIGLAVKKSRIPQRLRWDDFAPDYIRTAVQRGGLDFQAAARGAKKPLRIAVEAGNGMGGRIMREFANLNPHFHWTFSNEQPDGRFPVIVPNPLMNDYQRMVTDLVLGSKSDVGVCFDGDADRVALADEKGVMLSPPLLAALVGRRLREKLGPGAVIAPNLACSWVVADTLGERARVTGDGGVFITPVGYGKIKVIMHKNPSIVFGAEHSGHYMFRDFYSADSGMLAGLTVLELVAELHAKGKTLSAEVEGLRRKYHESGEINFQLPADKPADDIIAEAVKKFSREAKSIYAVAEEGVKKIDKYPPPFEQAVSDVRVECKDWWFVMRKSGTEGGAGDICRLYVEAVGEAKLMEQKRDVLVKMIGPQYRM